MELTLREAVLSPVLRERLLALSADWEAEDSCYGYRKNAPEDLDGNRFFTAERDGQLIGYLFGHARRAERMTSILPDGTGYFEVEELYVRPEARSAGVGRRLFALAEETLRPEGVGYVLLTTATKNEKAILHFYLDELGMNFWSARLFKKL